MVNNGYDKPLAEDALKEGDDLVAFGKPFISNPDLVRRLREGAPLNAVGQEHLLRRRREGLHRLPGAGLIAAGCAGRREGHADPQPARLADALLEAQFGVQQLA